MNGEGSTTTNGKMTVIQYPVNLRDYFAGQALAGMTKPSEKENGWISAVYKQSAEVAYKFADAMLAEREKNQ